MGAGNAIMPGLFDQMLDSLLLIRLAGLLLVAFVIGFLSFFFMSRMGRRQKEVQPLAGMDQMVLATASAEADPAPIVRWLSPARQYLLPSDEKERISTSRRLLEAGFDQEHAPLLYHALKASMALILGLLLMLMQPFLPGNLQEYPGVPMIAGAAVGLILPSRALDMLRQRRQQLLIAGLPQMLDMLLICLSAGLNLPMAINRVHAELRLAHPIMADEMARVSAELNAGLAMDAALHKFAERTGLREVRGLVGTLVEAHRYGASLTSTLRDFTKDFRAIRLHRADLEAAKMSTRLVFPMVCCIWPSFFVVVVGPALLRMLEAFAG